ncbi:transcriptional regulator swi6 [Linnemannia schmuckeri]|uniref:Transcriptional regulator swi6 n=1 Tax=Linnemannia schmuckeri TaxID=64567 RepID=A0A9P5S4I2_9FUNG|nr:transcriptional regulator swi6 [Linnemannia schmuckeri]
MASDIYTAVYSGVPVYEVMCRGIAVMRRKQDSFLNATQILKVAGIEKGRRTKILEREVLPGEHEKIQGGYGKYQGTWVPFQRGKDLAKQYEVEPFLRALFEYDVLQGEVDTVTPTKEMALMAQKSKDIAIAKAAASPRQSPSAKRVRSSSAKPGAAGGSQTFSTASMTPSPLHPSFNAPSPSIPPSPQWPVDNSTPARKRPKIHSPAQRYDRDFTPEQEHGHNLLHQQYRHQQFRQNGSGSSLAPPPEEIPLEGAERYRSILMAIFLNDDTEEIPSLLTDPTIPEDLDIDLVIDDQGHTALHWAAALARIQVLELLVQKHADVRRVNHNGESALIRAVLVTNNYDKQSFPHLLSILHRVIPTVDHKNRTMLHHIAMMAGVRGRGAASRYYMECLLEWIARNGGDFSSLVDIQDKNGDTALTIAARVGDRYLARFLIDVGANREIENKVGLRAGDFGVDDLERGPTEAPFVPRAFTTAPPSKEENSGKRGKDVMHVVQKMVDELDVEFSQEILARQGQLKDTQSLLRNATRELTETRRSIIDYRAQAQQVAEAQQKIKNLSISLEEESQRTRSHKGYNSKLRASSGDDIDELFNVRKPSSSSFDGTTTTGAVEGGEQDLKTRERMAEDDLVLLRSRVYAYQKNDEELALELAEAKSKTSANELLCKKVIAICCNIPLDKVDEMLVPLTLAVESDGASLDLSRVAGFMSRVKQQEGMGITASTSSSSAVPSALGP